MQTARMGGNVTFGEITGGKEIAMTVQDLLRKINEKRYSVVAIRHLCEDEDYCVGDICRNSFQYDLEYDNSSYYTNPIELNGTCGYAIFDICDLEEDEVEKAKEQLIDGLKKSADYRGKPVIIAGYRYEYGWDEEEVVIPYAEVIATSIEEIM